MHTTFLLIRHGATHHLLHTLSGRAPNIPLNDEGRTQAETLAELLASTPIHAIYTSPILRARDTANILAKPHNLSPIEDLTIQETNWGDWTLQTYANLDKIDAWRNFNQHRHLAAPPNGESFPQVTQRVISWLEAKALHHRRQTVAVISHADPIKAALLHYSHRPLSDIQNITIDPATYSALVFPHTSPPYLLCTNNRQTAPHMLPTYIA